MLNGRDGEAVDVADGTIADAEAGEDAQVDVVFVHTGVLLADVGEAVVVDGVERTFYLAPFVRTEIDARIGTLAEFLYHFRSLKDEVLQESHHLVGLTQQRLLMPGLLQELLLLLSL